jgi:hypothetical protein
VNALDHARTEAEEARSQLRDTVALAKDRTRPAALFSDVKKAASRRATQAAIASLSNAKTRPIIAVGVAVTAIAYLFRTPLLKALRTRLAKETEHVE